MVIEIEYYQLYMDYKQFTNWSRIQASNGVGFISMLIPRRLAITLLYVLCFHSSIVDINGMVI